MKSKKSIIILNNDGEYESFNKIIKYNKEIFKLNLIVIDRRTKKEFKYSRVKNPLHLKEVLLFCSTQKWIDFISSAERAFSYIFRSFEIDNLYIFSKYDPLVAMLLYRLPDLKLTIINQNPIMESQKKNRYFKNTLKGIIKTVTFFLQTRIICPISYKEQMQEFKLPKNINPNYLRLYPNKIKNLFEFGKIYTDLSNVINPVFISSTIYELPIIKYKDYLDDVIRFIKGNNINHISFHPREKDFFKRDIKSRLPNLEYHNKFHIDNYDFKPVPVSISSQVCFDLLMEGFNVAFVPQYFPSTYLESSINNLRNYLMINEDII